MSLEMKVPTVGESITEVTLAQWLKNDGDYVEMDEIVAELESDKPTFELPAEKAGMSVEDEILSVNSYPINNDLDKWLQYFEGEEITLNIKRKYGEIKGLKMISAKEIYFANYELRKLEKVSKEQEMRYREWSR